MQVEYTNIEDEVSIFVNPNHEEHVPGSRADLYNLPIHPSVVESCLNDLFDVGSSRHVAQMSLSKERWHLERSSTLDRVIYKFFMIPKEIQSLSYNTRIAGLFLHNLRNTMLLAKCTKNIINDSVLYCRSNS